MTTEAQLQANRRNAKRSTGPNTRGGKEASSKNARKHGLTAVPKFGPILNWYRVILNDDTVFPEPFEQNNRLRAAYSLAEAEARLEQVRRVEADLLMELHAPDTSESQDFNFPIEVLKQLDPDTRSMLRVVGRLRKGITSDREKQSRVLARYRREAEAARRAALRRWIRLVPK